MVLSLACVRASGCSPSVFLRIGILFSDSVRAFFLVTMHGLFSCFGPLFIVILSPRPDSLSVTQCPNNSYPLRRGRLLSFLLWSTVRPRPPYPPPFPPLSPPPPRSPSLIYSSPLPPSPWFPTPPLSSRKKYHSRSKDPTPRLPPFSTLCTRSTFATPFLRRHTSPLASQDGKFTTGRLRRSGSLLSELFS